MTTPAHDRPTAAPGLTSYRYRSHYGWVMIGAEDEADALREAERSIRGKATRALLHVWSETAGEYVPVRGDPRGGRAPAAGPKTVVGVRKMGPNPLERNEL